MVVVGGGLFCGLIFCAASIEIIAREFGFVLVFFAPFLLELYIVLVG